MLSIVAITLSFLITFILTPRLISFSTKRGLYDVPIKGNNLKIHQKPIPHMGGIGVYIGFGMTFLLLILFIMPKSGELFGILLGSLAILCLGLWDDLKNIDPKIRLIGYFLLAIVVINFGLSIKTIPLNIVAIPLTVFYIVGSINAMNVFDGLDGLAGGVTAISLIGFSLLFGIKGNELYLILCLSLLGAVCAFLCYNYHPAKIFMGDNGSTLLGLILAILGIKISSRPYNIVYFIVPILIIGLPIMDIFWAIVRRYRYRKPIFIGDRSHIYDQIMDKGLTVRQTAIVCYSIQALLALLGVLIFLKFK